jgi:hypothetical protein
LGEAGTGTANGNTDLETIRKNLDGFVELGLQLVHWWSYDTCRQASFGDDESWNMNMTEFPESVALVKKANENLKNKWLVNRADEEIVMTDLGDNVETTDSETTPSTDPITDPDTTAPTTVGGDDTNGGCASAILPYGIILMTVTVFAAVMLCKKRRESDPA